jgi:carboxypeptidase Q
MTKARMLAPILCTLLFSIQITVLAQSAVDSEINNKIRQEETDHSHIMHTMHFLTDVYGPRLTGSPNHKAAADWAIREMTSWGFQNGHLEPWDFGHPGWMNERASGYIVSPIHDQLTFKVWAWTPGTKGTVRAEVFQMILPDKPKQADLDTYLDSVKDKVKGKIVMVGKAEFVPVVIDVPARRMDDKVAAERYDPKNPNAGQFGRGGGPGGGQTPPEPGVLTGAQINEAVDKFLVAHHAAMRVNDARMGNGHIRAFQNRTYDVAKAPPTVVLRNEDYGRIARIMADGSPVSLEFNIVNHNYPEGKTSYNTVAEIPGTDKKDEIIMLGGHLDSWHSATGATDNAIGCAVMMEAARILEALGVKPRRTIRVALWSGEEEGLLGSQAYVKQHFGTFEEPKAEFDKLVAYFNVDSGTGRVRGASVFGPSEDADILRQALAPFADLGVAGAIPSKSRRLGGTDSTSFSQAGLPGIGLGQDPIEYFVDTWHTNLDTYERIIEDDAKKSAIVVAAAIYQLAMRDDMMPRFTKADMPAKPPADQPGGPQAQPARPAAQAEPAKPEAKPGAAKQ